MPRIDAASIEEHVRVQTARILAAATKLFQANGFRKTDMDDIAKAVGLARNSLYRYYPNKDFILLACVERDMGAYIEQMHTLGTQYPDPLERIGAWLDMQIDMATSPAHATLEHMAEIRSDAPELRKKLTGAARGACGRPRGIHWRDPARQAPRHGADHCAHSGHGRGGGRAGHAPGQQHGSEAGSAPGRRARTGILRRYR